jgi:DNA-binding NarL/FixJ family response regulator
MSVPAASVAELSASEWEIIQKIKLGLSNKEISQKLFLSEGTVRNYLSNILSKLALRDRTQLAIWALQNEGIMAQTTNLA